MTTTITSAPPVDVLAWVDVETTGLDAAQHHLLEVACILTDTDLNEIGEPFQAVIHHVNPSRLRATANIYVQDMHDKTGLWDRIGDGISAADVDTALLAHIARHAPAPRQARVAGNSVRLDLNFLEANLPATYAHLHYRSVDVSAVTTLMGWWFQQEPMPKQLTHSALDDIRESLAELRIHKSFLTNHLTPTSKEN